MRRDGALCMHDPIQAYVRVAAAMRGDYWANPRSGWLYAGITRSGPRLLKFGGTKQCPWCRISNYKRPGLELVSLAFSEDWRVNEQAFLEKLGKPARGLEWFDEADSRAQWLHDVAGLHTPTELMIATVRMTG